MTSEQNRINSKSKSFEVPEHTAKLLKKLESRPESEIMNSEALRVVRSIWPAAFHVSNPTPLKLGIHKDMMETGLIGVHIINTALRFFTTLERYLEAIKPGTVRIDLEGKPAGKVKLREAVDAEVKLFNLEIHQQPKRESEERKQVVITKMRLLAVKKPS